MEGTGERKGMNENKKRSIPGGGEKTVEKKDPVCPTS